MLRLGFISSSWAFEVSNESDTALEYLKRRVCTCVFFFSESISFFMFVDCQSNSMNKKY